MDPFAAALDALFDAPGSAAAVYVPVEGSPVAVRVIRSQPDALTGFGDGRVIMATNIIEVRKSEVSYPDRRDYLAIGGDLVDGVVSGGDLFSISEEPRLDVEGLTWTLGVEPYAG
jgi:hypothetical protein